MIDSLSQLTTPDALFHTTEDGRLPSRHEGVRNVLLDADDTLWENNIFFIASMEWLCGVGRSLGHTERATMGILNHWETINIARMGYGYASYEASFLATIRALVARSGRGDLHGGLYRRAKQWVQFLSNHPIVWLAGVEETLPKLTKSFRAIIVTKGDQHDQMAKVIRSGRINMFHGAEVVPQKYPDNYHVVLKKFGLDPGETVMVGNSPRSDINMARRAGLRTVYIPHAQSWFREMEPIEDRDPPTIAIARFDQLLDVLAP